MRLLFIAILICTQFSSFAQSAYVRRNTVYTDNEEMFRIYSVGSLTHQTYKIKSLNEEELIMVDQTPLRNNQGTLLMKFNFTNMPDAEAYMPLNVNFKKQLARLLVNYNVIKNNKLDAANVDMLCKNYSIQNYPSKYIAGDVTKPETAKSDNRKSRENNTINEKEEETENVINTDMPDEEAKISLDENGNIKRDITQQIYLSGTKIRQDYKEIGSYKEENKLLLGQEGKQITIYSHKGNKVGIARYINTDEQCELLTINDNKTWNIPIPKGDIYVVVKEIVKILVDRSYL